jgi:hypothetical protein
VVVDDDVLTVTNELVVAPAAEADAAGVGAERSRRQRSKCESVDSDLASNHDSLLRCGRCASGGGHERQRHGEHDERCVSRVHVPSFQERLPVTSVRNRAEEALSLR